MRPCALALLLLSCAHPAPKPEVTREVGPITLRGLAHNAKRGAILLQPDATSPIYIGGLAAWPPELLGERVSVTGRLTEQKLIEDPVNERGELVQGATGTQSVLEDAVWKLE